MSGGLCDSGKFPAQEDQACATMPGGYSNDGRGEGRENNASVRTDHSNNGAAPMDSPSVSQLKERRDKAIKDFVQLDKSFHDNVKSGKFADSEESLPAYEVVETAFDYLCTAQGELAAITGGTWHAIAAFKPAYMSHKKALEKKKDAVIIATISLKLKQEEVAAHKARQQAEEIANEAKEAAERVCLAAERLLKEAKHASDRAQEVAAQIAKDNAAAIAKEELEAAKLAAEMAAEIAAECGEPGDSAMSILPDPVLEVPSVY